MTTPDHGPVHIEVDCWLEEDSEPDITIRGAARYWAARILERAAMAIDTELADEEAFELADDQTEEGT